MEELCFNTFKVTIVFLILSSSFAHNISIQYSLLKFFLRFKLLNSATLINFTPNDSKVFYIVNSNFRCRKSGSNVNVSFQRFENQGRKTIQMHMSVWLKSIGNLNVSNIRATIPSDHTYLAYLVRIIYHIL